MSLSPSPPGTVVREPEDILGKRVLGVMIVVPFGVLILSRILGFAWAIVVASLVLGIAFMLAKDSLLAMLNWDPPLIQISSAPYPLGSSPTIVYRRKPKRVIDISSCQVDCVLVCEERATYTQGTDTSTDTRRVYESRSIGNGEGTADGLVAELELDISAHLGAPTFKLPHNEVRWTVEIGASGARLPKDTHRFEIDVGAVLDPSLRVGVQDT